MNLEEKLQQMLGQQAFTIAVLQIELDKAREQIAKLEKERVDEQDAKVATVGKNRMAS
jgi:FtsZ-binding cell division protein ZapB